MAAESASEVRKAYRQWIRFFCKVLFDLGTEFEAEFRRQVESDGSEAAAEFAGNSDPARPD